MSRDDVYLRHILDAVNKVERYTAVGRDRFLAETHWHDAVIRQLEIVGEATKRLSPELRARFPDVPWRRLAGLRDVLVHNCMGVGLDAVWEITQTRIPDLRQQVMAILTEDESASSWPALMGELGPAPVSGRGDPREPPTAAADGRVGGR